ncbi:hypothetical protein MWU59_06560 [Flavobacteriaceae bacterium F08102]|nr:hypothetical protein [Flavobacteriaceae bacterium F08102]
MKLMKFAFAAALCILFTACTSDDSTENLDGLIGDISLKFDNGVGDQDFIFETTYTKSNNETYKLSTLKYLISNVRLTDDEGNIFEYPSDKNVFIVDEADSNNAGEIYITLEDVDAANYTSITFGIGIDQERYLKGADGQGDFLSIAQEEGMLWSWATGYRFTRFDGVYTSGTEIEQGLNIHMGSVGTSIDNYREVTLPLPTEARVRPDKITEVHIKADISKVFDGVTSINFSDGYSQVHTSAETTPVIADNMMHMFMVHHVHNE